METKDRDFVERKQTKYPSETVANNQEDFYGDIRLKSQGLFWRETVVSLNYRQLRLSADIRYKKTPQQDILMTTNDF